MISCVQPLASPALSYPTLLPQAFDSVESLLGKALQPKTLLGAPTAVFPATLPSGVSGIAIRADGGVVKVEVESAPATWTDYWLLKDGESVFFPGSPATAWRVASVSGTPTIYVSYHY